jgi:hypothetical protein
MEIINGKPYGEVPGDHWTSKLQRALRLPLGVVKPCFAVSVERDSSAWPLPVGLMWFGSYYGDLFPLWSREWLFRNSYVFFRFCTPFCVAFSVRWSGSRTEKSHLDIVFGWRQNGVPGASFRIQSDVSSAEGFDIPNPGQAQGWKPGWR